MTLRKDPYTDKRYMYVLGWQVCSIHTLSQALYNIYYDVLATTHNNVCCVVSIPLFHQVFYCSNLSCFLYLNLLQQRVCTPSYIDIRCTSNNRNLVLSPGLTQFFQCILVHMLKKLDVALG